MEHDYCSSSTDTSEVESSRLSERTQEDMSLNLAENSRTTPSQVCLFIYLFKLFTVVQDTVGFTLSVKYLQILILDCTLACRCTWNMVTVAAVLKCLKWNQADH